MSAIRRMRLIPECRSPARAAAPRGLGGRGSRGAAGRTRQDAVELPEAGALPPMPGQCELVGAGVGDELAPDELAAEDELAADVDEVVRATVVPVAPGPPVAASATPVAPAPTPAATMPVMISRRARPPILEAIWFLPSRPPPHSAAGSSRTRAWAAGLPPARGRALSAL
jgi:hypothetical protein